MTVPVTETRVGRRATRQPTTRQLVVTGAAALLAVVADIDALAVRCGAPLTARGPWLHASLESLADAGAWGVLTRDPEGELVGAVLLVDEFADLTETTRLLGTDSGHRGAVLTSQPAVAAALGRAVAETIGSRRRWPQLDLGPLPASDPALGAFVASFDGYVLEQSAPIPGIRRTGEVEVGAYLSDGMARTVRKARNRLAKDGRRARSETTNDATVILEMLPRLEQLHRERDRAHGRDAYLDDEVTAQRWRQRIRGLAVNGCLELSTLLIDGELAAFVLGSEDGSSYRLLEGRFASAFARYAPGRLLESTVVQRWLDDDAMCSFDWMTGAAPETLLVTNTAESVVRVQLRRLGGDPWEPR